ncbi:unnamed protein product [Alternaria alternata]
MSSSLNFGSRIKSLHSENVTDSVGSTSICDASPDNVYNLEPGGLKHRTTSTDITWPSEEQAHDLLNTVLASIGSLQHLIDPRSFSDKLCSFYEDDSNRTGIDDLCYIEILMVFALGELLQGKMEEGSTFPGATYFLEAVSCLPSLCDLRKSGTLAIEIMGLFAFFLQCSDRKDDAYVYAGVALRLAMSNGLSRDDATVQMKRSEKTHRNRLWWTIYMQERRLAAATGNPVGILDDNITTKLPIESAGFSPTPALKINIEIARLSGLITQGLYGLKGRSEGQFLRTVHDLLGELKSVRRDLAAEFPLEFSKAFAVTRTGATLYLMLFQAIILTTRPILLHLAKSKLQGNDTDLSSTASSTLHVLAATCIEAAGMTLDVLLSLKQQELLAKFGYFDLDAAISAAFIFILVESLQSVGSPRSGLHGIRSATSILQYLTKHGNKAAAKRMLDVEHICQHLGIGISVPTIAGSPAAAAEGPSDNLDHGALCDRLPSAEDTTMSNKSHAADTYQEPTLATNWRQALFELPDHTSRFSNSLGFDNESYDIPSIDDIGDFNLDFGNDFMLTGADEIDWEEFERQIPRNQ